MTFERLPAPDRVEDRDPARPSRDTSVDLLKGLAIIAVVLHHIGNRRFSPETVHAVRAAMPAWDWAVVTFVFLSGFLHARSRRQGSLPDFIYARARRLLVPYLAIGLAYAAIMQAIQGRVLSDPNPGRPATLTGKVAALLSGNAVGEQLYFFPLLFIVSVGYTTMVVLIGRPRAVRLLPPALLACTVATAVVVRGRIPTSGLDPAIVVIGTYHYSLGFAFGRSESQRAWLWTAFALAATSAIAAAVVDVHLYTLGFPLAALMLCRALPRWAAFVSPPLVFLGVASGTIFAYHDPFVLQTLLVVLCKLHVPDVMNIVASLATMFAACAALHVLLCRVPWLKPFRI